jgi:hypothetical protein
MSKNKRGVISDQREALSSGSLVRRRMIWAHGKNATVKHHTITGVVCERTEAGCGLPVGYSFHRRRMDSVLGGLCVLGVRKNSAKIKSLCDLCVAVILKSHFLLFSLSDFPPFRTVSAQNARDSYNV